MMNTTTRKTASAIDAQTQHTPIPGPFHADGNAVFALDHGQLYTVLRVNGARLTDEAQAQFAQYVVRACNAHDDLVAALREVLPLAECYARDNREDVWLDRLNAARAVLAKVTS